MAVPPDQRSPPGRPRLSTASWRGPLLLISCASLATIPLLPNCRGGGEQETSAVASAGAELHVPPLGDFDADLAFAHLEEQVRIGPRIAGSQAAEFARVHIETTLRALGLAPRRESFTAHAPLSTGLGEVPMANVIVDLPGTVPSAADSAASAEQAPETHWVLLGAHYDTKRMTPDSGLSDHVLGANDGASGVALLLEIARLLAASQPRPVSYRLVFFDGEESLRWRWLDPDNRYGSRHHAANLVKSGERDRFKAMVLVDLVADRELDLVHDLNSDGWLRDLFFDKAKALGYGKHVGKYRLAVSDDHLSFREIRIPVLDLIDLNYPDETNRFWHTNEDTLENVSAQSLGIVGQIVARTLPDLERRLLSAP